MIIEVDGGKFERLDVVKQGLDEQGNVLHYVLWDKDCKNTERYGISAWPVGYLLGVDGRVKWEGNPARVVSRPPKLAELEELIQTELENVKQ